MVNLLDLIKTLKENKDKKEAIYQEGMTVVPSAGIGREWEDEVIQMADRTRIYEHCCYTDMSLVNTKDSIAHIPVQTARPSWVVTPPAGGGTGLGTRRWTKMDTHVSVVSVEVRDVDWRYPGVAISEYNLNTSPINFAQYAIDQMTAAFRDIPEMTIVAAAQDRAAGAGDVPAIYGGTATNVSGLAAGNVLTPALLIRAKSILRNNGFIADTVVCSPEQIAALERDSQFTDALRYGSNEITIKGFGEVAKFVGLKICVSEIAPVYAAGANDLVEVTGTPPAPRTWGVAGARAIMFGKNRAGNFAGIASVWKQKPKITTRFDDVAAAHLIMGSFAHTARILNPRAMVFINTSLI